MREKRFISFENHSSRSGRHTTVCGLPLKIFVSVQTGRRYLCLYFADRRRFGCLRLDCIFAPQPLEICPQYDQYQNKLARNLPHCWGVSFGGHSRMETLCMKLYIDESSETHIIERLKREGRGGQVEKVRENVFLYTGSFFDANEMLPWVKSFTGRILDLQCSNKAVAAKVTADWEAMYQIISRNPE